MNTKYVDYVCIRSGDWKKMCSGLLINQACRSRLTYQVYGMGDLCCGWALVSAADSGILVWLFHLTTDENYCMEMAKELYD